METHCMTIDSPKSWAASRRASANKILPPFLGNFRSVARASSEISDKPDAIRNGKKDQRTLKIMMMY